MTKPYPIVCPSCHGEGKIIRQQFVCSAVEYITCPSCSGTGRVTVTDYDEFPPNVLYPPNISRYNIGITGGTERIKT